MAASVPRFAEFVMGKDDWIIYAKRLDQFFTASGITDDKLKVANLLNCIGTDTYKLSRNLCYPTIPKDKKFIRLCEFLKAHCCPQINVWRERRK